MRGKTALRTIESSFALVHATALRPHELTEGERLLRLSRELRYDRILQHPILVDMHSLVILDGHHRVESLKALGCSLIPAYLLDYWSPLIRVESRRENQLVTKDIVVHRGLRRRPFPPRTSRHTLVGQIHPYPVELSRLLDKTPSRWLHRAAQSPSWRT